MSALRNLLLLFLLFLLAVGGLAAFAWQRTGRDRYAALEQQGLGLARVFRDAALESRATLRTAEDALAQRLLTVARRMDESLTRTRASSAEVLQDLAEEEGVGRVFLLNADLEPVSRARTPPPLPSERGALITAEEKADIEWTEAIRSARELPVGAGESRVEGFHTNVFGTRDRFGLVFGRPAGGVLLLRANADEIAAIRRRFGIEPLLERAVELPDVLAVTLVDADGQVLLGAGDVGESPLFSPGVEASSPPRVLAEKGALRIVETLDDSSGVWLDLRLSRSRADAAVHASRSAILWGAGGALFVALLALLALRRMESRFQTARSLAAERLEEERRLAEMGALAGLVTHELSNPLNALRLGVRLLTDSKDETERARVLETMRAESSRVTRRLEEFLQLASRQTARRERIDASILDRVAERARVAASTRGVRLVQDVQPSARAAAGDAVVLEEALMNLVRNAIEASPEQGTVTLRWADESDAEVRVCVTDEGPGFPDDPARLLRLGGAKPRRGHGLGLVLTRRFVQGNGGRLVLSNLPTGGGCVDVVLPAWESRGE